MSVTCIGTGKCLPLDIQEMLFCEISPELPACCYWPKLVLLLANYFCDSFC